MSKDEILAQITKILEDEDFKATLTGLTRSIGYWFWAARQLQRSQEALGKLRNGEPLTGKEARKLIALFTWLAYHAGANWTTAQRYMKPYFDAADSIKARSDKWSKDKKAQRETETEALRKAAKDVSDAIQKARDRQAEAMKRTRHNGPNGGN